MKRRTDLIWAGSFRLRRRSSTLLNEATKAERFRAIRICYFGMFVSSIVFSITVASLWPFLQIVKDLLRETLVLSSSDRRHFLFRLTQLRKQRFSVGWSRRFPLDNSLLHLWLVTSPIERIKINLHSWSAPLSSPSPMCTMPMWRVLTTFSSPISGGWCCQGSSWALVPVSRASGSADFIGDELI